MCLPAVLVLSVLTKIVYSDLLLNTPRTCEPIRIELCKGLGYNETSMPNLVGHELQTDVDFTLQSYAPLIQFGCSAQLQFFLCSAYVPMCTTKVPNPIGPCRSLCETVRNRCNPVLQGFGFSWPSALDCNLFPKENKPEHMCMQGPGEPSSNEPNYPNFPTPTTRITSLLSPNCYGLVKSHLYIRLNRSGKCAPLCDADILFDQKEKHIAELWVTAWSYAVLGIAVIATLCLFLNDAKWDRVFTPLVTCHSLVAIGWTVRFVSGRSATSCGYDPQLPNVSLLLLDGLSNASCAATFLLRYYFGMSAAVWWSILCLEWHRGIRRTRIDFNEPTIIGSTNGIGSNSKANNGSVAIANKKINTESFSNLAQLAAWGLPAVQTVAVLVARVVDADELLGACFVGNQSDKALRFLVATPLFCYWIFGSVNLFAGYLIYRRSKAYPSEFTLHMPNSQSIVTVQGIGAFLFIYCVPSAILLISVFYEFANRDEWLNMPVPSFKPTEVVKAPLWAPLLRAFMELILGLISSAWVLGPRLHNLYKSKMDPKIKQVQVKYPATTCSTASYQSVRQPPSTIISMDKIPKYHSSYRCPNPSIHSSMRNKSHHHSRPSGGYKISSQTLNQYGHETIL